LKFEEKLIEHSHQPNVVDSLGAKNSKKQKAKTRFHQSLQFTFTRRSMHEKYLLLLLLYNNNLFANKTDENLK
jgi:hypothetical protein